MGIYKRFSSLFLSIFTADIFLFRNAGLPFSQFIPKYSKENVRSDLRVEKSDKIRFALTSSVSCLRARTRAQAHTLCYLIYSIPALCGRRGIFISSYRLFRHWTASKHSLYTENLRVIKTYIHRVLCPLRNILIYAFIVNCRIGQLSIRLVMRRNSH